MIQAFKKLPWQLQVAIAAALGLMVVVLAATLRFWLVPVAVVGMGVLWLMEKQRDAQMRQAQAQAYRLEVLRRSVLDCLFTAAVECCDAVGVRRPRQAEDIATTPSYISRNGIWMPTAKLRLTNNAPRTPDDLEDIAFEIQEAVTAQLSTYGCEYIPAASWDRQHPLFVVDRVVQKGASFIVEIVVSDTPATSSYLTTRHNQDPHLLPPAEPEDERF